MSLEPLRFPFDPVVPHFDEVVELDGRRYSCRVVYNQRADRYTLDLALEGGDALASGVRIIPGRPLLRRYSYRASHPGGELVLIVLEQSDAAPGLGEVGDGKRTELWYLPAELVATAS
jgi:hypothetical protein